MALCEAEAGLGRGRGLEGGGVLAVEEGGAEVLERHVARGAVGEVGRLGGAEVCAGVSAGCGGRGGGRAPMAAVYKSMASAKRVSLNAALPSSLSWAARTSGSGSIAAGVGGGDGDSVGGVSLDGGGGVGVVVIGGTSNSFRLPLTKKRMGEQLDRGTGRRQAAHARGGAVNVLLLLRLGFLGRHGARRWRGGKALLCHGVTADVTVNDGLVRSGRRACMQRSDGASCTASVQAIQYPEG